MVAYAYIYTFTYSNGDWYTGVVYAEPENYQVIATEDSWSWVINEVEHGLTGTYHISGSG